MCAGRLDVRSPHMQDRCTFCTDSSQNHEWHREVFRPQRRLRDGSKNAMNSLKPLHHPIMRWTRSGEWSGPRQNAGSHLTTGWLNQGHVREPSRTSLGACTLITGCLQTQQTLVFSTRDTSSRQCKVFSAGHAVEKWKVGRPVAQYQMIRVLHLEQDALEALGLQYLRDR